MSIFVIIPIGILNIFIFAIAIISRNDYILNIFIIISLNGYIVYILPLPDASRKTPAFHSHLGAGKAFAEKNWNWNWNLQNLRVFSSLQSLHHRWDNIALPYLDHLTINFSSFQFEYKQLLHDDDDDDDYESKLMIINIIVNEVFHLVVSRKQLGFDGYDGRDHHHRHHHH